EQIQHVAHLVFTQAFVDAMRPTMALAIAIILAGAITALAARNRPIRSTAGVDAEPQQAPASVA
ncbi:MAG TPA: hypothetical protein VIT43_09840, partial [Candidatus Dormibacteraeota bacterium]